MDLPRFIISFQPQAWVRDVALDSEEALQLDVTAILLNTPASALSAAFGESGGGAWAERKIVELIEDRVLAHFEAQLQDVMGPHDTYRIELDGEVDALEFFKKNRIDNPKDLTEQDLDTLRQQYNIPREVTMPNGRRFYPEVSDNGSVFIEGSVLISTNDLLARELESVLDQLSLQLTGSDLLMDISYKAVGVDIDKNATRLCVRGDAQGILACEYANNQHETVQPPGL